MYDELVMDLREKAEFLTAAEPLSIKNAFAEAMKQAADAIEELRRKYTEERNAAVELTGELATVAAKLPRWIPVTERLPEHGWYLAYGPTIKMEVLHFHSVEEVWSSERYYNINVTHWMPLPEPPKEE